MSVEIGIDNCLLFSFYKGMDSGQCKVSRCVHMYMIHIIACRSMDRINIDYIAHTPVCLYRMYEPFHVQWSLFTQTLEYLNNSGVVILV